MLKSLRLKKLNNSKKMSFCSFFFRLELSTQKEYNVREKRLNERDTDASQACFLVLTYFMDSQ